MKRTSIYKFSILILLVCAVNSTYAWGPKGHRAVGEIAQRNLKPSVKRKIAKLLNHESIAIVSTFPDDIKSDRQYSKFFSWHFLNITEGESYAEAHKNPDGDLITGIAYCKQVIKDPKASDEDKRFYLKFLIHMIGDMHQPLHLGRFEDKGGNDIKVTWHRKKTNLHSLWDSKMIESFGLSFTELVDEMPKLTRKERKAIQQGDLLDWVEDIRVETDRIYANAKDGDDLGYEYSYYNVDVARIQIQHGGLRLAKVLNELF